MQRPGDEQSDHTDPEPTGDQHTRNETHSHPRHSGPELAIPVPTVLLHATILDAAKWAGATFIAVTMLLLKIRELMR
jgi:hypothetical protein